MTADPANAKLDNYSVHAVASAVGGFFRELPEPLLTSELYVEFLRAMGKRGNGECVPKGLSCIYNIVKLETLHVGQIMC